MNFKENETEDKLRGGYYTPPAVARFLSRWVLCGQPRSLLEPSCGDGAFIRALEGLTISGLDITGVERQPDEAAKARKAANSLVSRAARVVTADFLQWVQKQLGIGVSFDAITGNPPYIRYQYLDEQDQLLSEQLFDRFSLAFTKHTNAWVPFVIACVALLSPGGRLAMVIPSELMHVLHAGSLRAFLLQQSKRVLMVDPNELLFETALQGTVLLMVEKKIDLTEPSKGVAVHAAPDNSFLNGDPEQLFQSAKYVSGDVLNGKWMKVLLEPAELAVFEKAKGLPLVKRFRDIAKVDVGIVTGANKFFLIDDSTVAEFGLEKFVKPMFGRSEHCPGIVYDATVHEANRQRGLPTNFLCIEKGTNLSRLPKRVVQYIKLGEEQQLHTRYKCRIRSPWFSVPSVYSTPIGLLKRSHNFPRLISNALGAFTTDTAYRITPLPGGPSAEALVYCFVNSLTALTAELEGRHYGGGVLELVPSEIEKLLVPLPALRPNLRQLDKAVRAGTSPLALLKTQDDKVLSAAGLSENESELLRQALIRIRSRRHRLLGEAMTKGGE
ncbi:Modification methylase Eco57IB [Achromobacter animicus]|uniref:Eco57I restriction-modification methylase domain-containing protein n=1 Tax=Achromobacter animicus TaxID=1389935 RepID=UPI0014671BCB|nr:N-6 DNA methylase [Achromobacter animicus]CAB3915413.1 Modification methylase Eco57IB [Achromobacter animicus]